MEMEHPEYKSYVVTLARLIDTKRRTNDEETDREVRRAIGRMRDHVIRQHGPLTWEAVEGDAMDTVRNVERSAHAGLILPPGYNA